MENDLKWKNEERFDKLYLLIYPLALNISIFGWLERIIMRIIFLANLIPQYIEFLQNGDSIPALLIHEQLPCHGRFKKIIKNKHTLHGSLE